MRGTTVSKRSATELARACPGQVRTRSTCTCDGAPNPKRETTPERELHAQIKAAPSGNRQFHASDLCRLIGQAAYNARVDDVIRQFG